MTEDERIESAANAMGFRTIDGQARVMAALAAAYPELHGTPTHELSPIGKDETPEGMVWVAPYDVTDEMLVAGDELCGLDVDPEEVYAAMRDAYFASNKP